MPLDRIAQALLSEIAAENRPSWPELPPSESRKIFNEFNSLFGEGPEVLKVQEPADFPDAPVPIRTYTPTADPHSAALLYFHGGGWVLGNLDTHDTLCRNLALESRRIVIAVDYRLAPENRYPAAIDDAYQALEFVDANADTLGIDRRRIAVAGDSAGGNLAAAVAIRSRNRSGPNIDCQILIYPVIEPDFETRSYRQFASDHLLTRETMQWFWAQYVGDLEKLDRSAIPEAALMECDLDRLPPAYVMTAEFDVLRDEGEQFAKRLRIAGNSVQFHQAEGMLHGFVHFSGLFVQGLDEIKKMGQFLQSTC